MGIGNWELGIGNWELGKVCEIVSACQELFTFTFALCLVPKLCLGTYFLYSLNKQPIITLKHSTLSELRFFFVLIFPELHSGLIIFNSFGIRLFYLYCRCLLKPLFHFFAKGIPLGHRTFATTDSFHLPEIFLP